MKSNLVKNVCKVISRLLKETPMRVLKWWTLLLNYCMAIKVNNFEALLKTVHDSFFSALLKNNKLFVDNFLNNGDLYINLASSKVKIHSRQIFSIAPTNTCKL